MARSSAGRDDSDVDASLAEDAFVVGKGRATPTRREREAANLRPLVSNDRRAANKEARAKLGAARERARIGMANGEDRYLREHDKGPQRKWVRDYIDARFSVGEFLLPVMFTFVLASLIPQIAGYFILVMFSFFLATVLDCLILGRVVTKRVAARFGADNVRRGTKWYSAMRAIQFRPMRLPKPQVKRRQFPA